MTNITTCPSCRGPLRVPDELIGQQVRCPVCQTAFEASANGSAPPPTSPPAEQDRPLWKDLQLELDKNDPEENQPSETPAPPRKPRLMGAVEVTPPTDDGSPPPAPRPPAPPAPPPSPRRPPPSDSRPADEYDEDYGRPRRSRYDRGPRRRDTEPHRGSLILVLGIISVVCVALSFCYGLGVLLGLPLGITAWVLGHIDLAKMKNQQMDEEGQGMTQAGWICGILGTILNGLILVSCGGFLAFVLIAANQQPSPPKPVFAPAPAAPGK